MAENIHVPQGKVNKLISLFETEEPVKPPPFLRRNSQRSSFLRQFSSEQLIKRTRPQSQEFLVQHQQEDFIPLQSSSNVEKITEIVRGSTQDDVESISKPHEQEVQTTHIQEHSDQHLENSEIEILEVTPKVEIARPSEFKATDEVHLIKDALENAEEPDCPVIIDLLTKKKSLERLRICDVYYEIFGKTLSSVFRSKLEGYLKTLMLALISSPHDYIAKEINRAMKGLGTDEDTLMELICIHDEQSLGEICEQYLLLFKCELKDAVKGDTSGSFKRILCNLLTSPRNNDECDPHYVASHLHEDSKNKRDTFEEVLLDLLTSYNHEFLKQVFVEYRKICGQNFETLLKEFFSGDSLKALTIIYTFSMNPWAYFAEKLHEATDGIGMKELSVIRIFVSRCEIDLHLIGKEYYRKYQKSLKQCIQENATGYFQTALISLLEFSITSNNGFLRDEHAQDMTASEENTDEQQQSLSEDKSKLIDTKKDEDLEHFAQQTRESCQNGPVINKVTQEANIVASETQTEENNLENNEQYYQLETQNAFTDNDKNMEDIETTQNERTVTEQDGLSNTADFESNQTVECVSNQTEEHIELRGHENLQNEAQIDVSGVQQVQKEKVYEEDTVSLENIVVDLEYDLPEHFSTDSNLPTVIYAHEFDELLPMEKQVEEVARTLQGLKSDLDALVFSICKRSFVQRHHLATYYKKEIGTDLTSAIKKEAVGYLEDTLTSLLLPRNIFLALCLNNVLRPFHVKEEIIIEILCPLSNEELREVTKGYKEYCGHDIEEDASKNLTGDFRDFVLCLLTQEKKSAPLKDVGSIVHKLCALKFPQEEKKKLLEDTMKSYPYRFLYHLFKVYETQTGSKFLDLITGLCSGLVGQALIAIYQCVVDRHGFFAGILRLAMRGIGTDELALIRVIVGRCEIDLGNIKKEFYKKYVKNLEDSIEDETSGYFCKALISLVEGNEGICLKAPLHSQNSLVVHEDIDSPTQEKAISPVIKAQEDIVAQSQSSAQVEVLPVVTETQELAKKAEGPQLVELPAHIQHKQIYPTITPALDCNPDADAKILHKAMKGLGTDEKAIVDLITKRSRNQCQDIIKSFHQLYNKDLICELKKELSGDLEDLLLDYVAPPSKYLAETLNQAINKKKNVDVVCEIIFNSDEELLKNTSAIYKDLFGKDLKESLRKFSEEQIGELLSEALEIKGCEDEHIPKKIAAQIGEDGTLSERSLYILGQYYNKETLFKIFHFYEKIMGTTFEEYTLAESKETHVKVALSALYESVTDPFAYFAKKLKKSVAGLGTDEKTLNRIIVSRCEIDLQKIKEKYLELFGESLQACVKSDTSGHYCQALIALLEGNKGYTCVYEPAQEEKTSQNTEAKQMLKKPQVTFSASDLYENIVAEQQSEQSRKESTQTSSDVVQSPKIPPPEYEKRPLYLRGIEGAPSMHPFDSFDVSIDVTALRKATKGLLTDEKTVIDLLTNRDRRQRNMLLEAYHKEHGKALIPKIKKKFCASSHLILSSLLTPRIAFLSKELYSSMKGLGTDEETLAEILCLCHPEDLRLIKDSYHIISDKPLKDQIVGDTSGTFKEILLQLLDAQREDPPDCDPEEEARELLNKSSKNKPHLSPQDLQRILVSYRHAYLYDLFYYIKQICGLSVNEMITKQTSGDVKMVLLTIYNSINNRYGFFATRLNSALKGRINERNVTRILIWRSEIDLENIKQEFQKMFGRTLKSALEEATSGTVRKAFVSLIELKKTGTDAKK